MFQLKDSEPTIDGWMFISCNDIYEPDEFVILVREYQAQISGKAIEKVGNGQYRIENDPHKLVFQYDDLFGIVVITPKNVNSVEARDILLKLCERTNEKFAGFGA